MFSSLKTQQLLEEANYYNTIIINSINNKNEADKDRLELDQFTHHKDIKTLSFVKKSCFSMFNYETKMGILLKENNYHNELYFYFQNEGFYVEKKINKTESLFGNNNIISEKYNVGLIDYIVSLYNPIASKEPEGIRFSSNSISLHINTKTLENSLLNPFIILVDNNTSNISVVACHTNSDYKHQKKLKEYLGDVYKLIKTSQTPYNELKSQLKEYSDLVSLYDLMIQPDIDNSFNIIEQSFHARNFIKQNPNFFDIYLKEHYHDLNEQFYPLRQSSLQEEKKYIKTVNYSLNIFDQLNLLNPIKNNNNQHKPKQ